MYKIVKKDILNANVFLMKIHSPQIAKRAKPGQFIILRIDEYGERIPLTIADYDMSLGLVTIIFQVVGATTKKLSTLEVGDSLLDFVGPLGRPSEIENIEKACLVAGGLGSAICYPLAKALHNKGAILDIIIGFRTKELVFLEEEFKAIANNLYVMTDDGSYKEKGLVTKPLEYLLDHNKYDIVFAVGPLIMMKNVSIITKEHNQKTIVSMNPIMIDGTGMCGGCRLTVDGKQKFACTDGPEFDAHLIDFDEVIARSKMYYKEEREADCRLMNYEKKN